MRKVARFHFEDSKFPSVVSRCGSSTAVRVICLIQLTLLVALAINRAGLQRFLSSGTTMVNSSAVSWFHPTASDIGPASPATALTEVTVVPPKLTTEGAIVGTFQRLTDSPAICFDLRFAAPTQLAFGVRRLCIRVDFRPSRWNSAASRDYTLSRDLADAARKIEQGAAAEFHGQKIISHDFGHDSSAKPDTAKAHRMV
jgi:hypothetical protein